jgi:transcriptional regulator with XRE-family HTH domain
VATGLDRFLLDSPSQLTDRRDDVSSSARRPSVNIRSSLTTELRNKKYRDGYVASQIAIGLPFQIRALRRSRGWTQAQLAEAAGMSQPRIAEIERAGRRRFNIDTLLRIASAFDVGLEVGFAPFGAVVDRAERFDPDAFDVASFDDDVHEAERRGDRVTPSKRSVPVRTSTTPSSRRRPVSQPATRG